MADRYVSVPMTLNRPQLRLRTALRGKK